MANADTALAQIALKLARAARTQARKVIESRKLKKAIQTRVFRQSRRTMVGQLHIPHYWAVYYHDGRRGFGPDTKKVLVWYKNPAKDPRREPDGGPVRAKNIIPLDEKQFRDAKEGNELYIRRRVGPAAGKHFFTKGMRPFVTQAGPIARQALDDLILGGLREDGALNVEETATGTIKVGF